MEWSLQALFVWAAQVGPWGLLLVAFLAATLLPLSSEVALITCLEGGMDPWTALIAASCGNVMACMLNYGLGYMGSDRARQKLQASHGGRWAIQWTDRYGGLSLLGSWLPVIGDPLTILAGVMRVPLLLFVPVVSALRVGRYALIAGIINL